MKITSTFYSQNQIMPVKFARQGVTGGQNISPQFSWSDAPSGTKSFVFAMVDHHPIASNWVHWIVVDIPAFINSIIEGASNTSQMPTHCVELANTFGTKGYGGPQPPAGTGKHSYDTTIYALNIEKMGLLGKISEGELLRKLQPYILDKATLSVLFGR